MPAQILLVRHGETAWSKSGQHTGRTDIPLNENGEHEARKLGDRLRAFRVNQVFTSPRLRARQTCELAGFATMSEIEPDLAEWDYGEYEGQRSADIHRLRPDWNIFKDGCPSGESPEQISERADRLIGRLRKLDGNILAFSHGHFGRVLAARWIAVHVSLAQHFLNSTASLGILGYEHNNPDMPAIALWNATDREFHAV